MIECKRCGKSNFTKNGFVRGMQRYRCKSCGCNFTCTPARGCPPVLKVLAILLYSMGSTSYRYIAYLLGVSHVSVYKWIRSAAASIPEPDIPDDIKEIELDEMWHFLGSKKTKDGYGKPMIVVKGVVSPGLWAAVIVKRFGDSGRRSSGPTVCTSPTIGPVTPK